MSFRTLKLSLCAALTATTGFFAPTSASHAGLEPFIGEMMLFAGNFCPRNYAKADGQLLAISANSALFSILGTMYGGDGRTTFGLPDLRGRVAINEGQGPGLSRHAMGQRGGNEMTTLTTPNIPSHNHGVSVTTTVISTVKAAGSGATNAPAGQFIAGGGDQNFGSRPPLDDLNAGSVSNAATSSVSQNNVGSGQPFSNVPPYLTMTYCIAVQGIFPSRS